MKRNVVILAAAAALLVLVASGVRAQKEKAPPAPVPETVTMSGLSHWFAPATFSHGAHASLAGDCGSCHHKSDGEVGPCGTCHPGQFDPSQPTLPSLNVAYHQRCAGCHEQAGAGPRDCEGCHKRKALPAGAPLKPWK